METKRLWGKSGGRVCYHGYQSFKADEVTAETAHEIGVRLAEELWGGRFEVVVATHCNTGHYHNHFVSAPIRGRVNPLSKRQARGFMPVVNG